MRSDPAPEDVPPGRGRESREPSKAGAKSPAPGQSDAARAARYDPARSEDLRREVLGSLEAGGPRSSQRQAHPAAKMAGVGLQFAGVVLLFTLGGHWLDQRLASEPWLLLIGLALGLVGGGLSLILSVQRTLR
jgi:F0F1-type ATP synthase assembly protein I